MKYILEIARSISTWSLHLTGEVSKRALSRERAEFPEPSLIQIFRLCDRDNEMMINIIAPVIVCGRKIIR